MDERKREQDSVLYIVQNTGRDKPFYMIHTESSFTKKRATLRMPLNVNTH